MVVARKLVCRFVWGTRGLLIDDSVPLVSTSHLLCHNTRPRMALRAQGGGLLTRFGSVPVRQDAMIEINFAN
jgi:hypothetical protein